MASFTIRESVLSSRSLASVTLGAEALLWRLALLADQMGRFHADPEFIRNVAFPLRPNTTQEHVAGWLQELEEAAQLCRYVIGGEPFLTLKGEGRARHPRSSDSRFPAHPGCECASSDAPTPAPTGQQLMIISPPPAIDPDMAKELRNSKWLAELATDRYAPFWGALLKTYDGMDELFIDEEIRKLDLWLEANPERRSRTPKGWMQRITNWMSKAQNGAVQRSAAKAQAKRSMDRAVYRSRR